MTLGKAKMVTGEGAKKKAKIYYGVKPNVFERAGPKKAKIQYETRHL